MVLKSRAHGAYILFLLAGLNFLNYATRNVVVTMYDDLRETFAMSNVELGLLSSVFMFAHAAMNIPFGWAGDRYDRKRVIAVGAVLWSIANIAAGFAAGEGSLIASRALAGLGTAACVPVANALICDVFPEARKARTVAILNLGLFLGGGAGFVSGSELGFPLAFWIIAAPGVLLAGLLLKAPVPSRPNVEAKQSLRDFLLDARRLLSIRTLRWTLQGAVWSAFAAGGYITWFADFLTNDKGFSVQEATYTLGGLALSGGLAGVLFGGYLGDRLRRKLPYGRITTMALGHALAVPCALLAIYLQRGVLFYAASWLLMFFINWYHGPMAATVDDVVARRRATVAQGMFIAVMHLLGTSTAPVVVGLLVDRLNIRDALLLPTVALAAAALCYVAATSSWSRDRERALAAQ